MLPEKRDAAYLWDMRDAARDIVGWVQGVTYDQFCTNEMLHSAVERKLEVFGEAAGRVSTATQEGHPEIPWKDIKGVRVILAHKYADIELGVIWQAAINELPNILSKIDELMAPFEKES
jgi:uncharacterized protein with HEPN domain